jgi:hypothetical protein
MKLTRLLFGALFVTGAGLLGNWVGERIREGFTGEPGHELTLFNTDETGQTVVALNPLMTNLLPALLGAVLGKPRWYNAFVYGAMASALMGDQYEEKFWELLRENNLAGGQTIESGI